MATRSSPVFNFNPGLGWQTQCAVRGEEKLTVTPLCSANVTLADNDSVIICNTSLTNRISSIEVINTTTTACGIKFSFAFRDPATQKITFANYNVTTNTNGLDDYCDSILFCGVGINGGRNSINIAANSSSELMSDAASAFARGILGYRGTGPNGTAGADRTLVSYINPNYYATNGQIIESALGGFRRSDGRFVFISQPADAALTAAYGTYAGMDIAQNDIDNTIPTNAAELSSSLNNYFNMSKIETNVLLVARVNGIADIGIGNKIIVKVKEVMTNISLRNDQFGYIEHWNKKSINGLVDSDIIPGLP